jgi:selenocysteine-specific elongation factor
MIVGTAGHIDHGKTTLVRALTGVDTDRLKEEKARGISIELGYAYTPMHDGRMLGFIDVPGHEKLIHTMAAGASGVGLALLVIAADDGVMPQTREHLAILELLGVRRGVVALTKSDRVTAARASAVEAEIATLLAATPFAGAPVFRTQAQHDGDAGVAALRAWLEQAAATVGMADTAAGRLFRLAVDRIFSLPGQGTIVTGTAFAGRVSAGDALRLTGEDEPVRVRGIHAQSRAAEHGEAGQRLALNLAGVGRERVARGDWIVDARLNAVTVRFDADMILLADADAPLRTWAPVHVHLGAAHRVAHLVLLDDDEALRPGAQARVQLVFETPLHALPGDRFVVRNAQASRTIGGGRVLDPDAPARKRRTPARRSWLDALAELIDTGRSDALLRHSPNGLRRSVLVRLAQTDEHRLSLPADTTEVRLRNGDAILVATEVRNALRARAVEALRDFHLRLPDEPGPQVARLGRIVDPALDPALWRAVVDALATSGVIVVNGPFLHLPEHGAELDANDRALADSLLQALHAGGFNPPWVRNLARSFQVPETTVRQLLCKLARQAQVYQVVPDLFYHPERVAELARLVASVSATTAADGAATDGSVEAGRFRDVTGLGRKRAIQLLEFFDRIGYTRRVRDTHLIRPGDTWSLAEA